MRMDADCVDARSPAEGAALSLAQTTSTLSASYPAPVLRFSEMAPREAEAGLI